MNNVTHTIYQENILDHNQHPRNKGQLKGASFSYAYRNPSCGDRIEIHVKIVNGRVSGMTFDGIGCAVSTASTSIMTEQVTGKSIADIQAMTKQDVFSYLGIPISPGRETCALLPLLSLHNGLKQYNEHKN